ncbi:hypothetical protein BT96DRAFT_1019165 [Gymnopus androsaceus JB14]|uniref:RBR-type E3 ubiquitin transferase n=1 Tax=Gymnopus androsaceus JB14 TaxID=1447944 RepID=A0A6A4HRN2_9AGAR|nr:hypothetical protein BT96DRAFT_1019165 [Gymnopus androsaceus JB14]
MEEEEGREYVEGTDTPADHHGSLEEPDEEMEEWPAEEQEDGEGSIGEVKSTNEMYDGRTMEEARTEVVDSWQSSNGWNIVDDAWNEYQNEPRKTLPCKAFGQGHCRFGDNCHYLHIAPEAADDWQHDSGVTETVDAEEIAPIELEESLDEPLPIIRQSFYCDINYGQTTRPEKIVTSFESDTIRIYNIPLSFGEDDIFGLVSPFGTVLEMQTEFSEDPTYHATVKFSSQTEAEEAVKRLRDLELVTEHTLQVYLGSKAQIMYDWRPSAPGRSVKISYPNPSREAWVCFQTMDLYKKAGGLDGEMFGGRKIAVLKERRPPKNRNYYYLRVSGLPLAAGKQEIKAFFKDCMLVEMITPTYTTPPVNEIDTLLQQHGELEELDMLPFSDEKPRNLGFARFASADAASRAIHALNNTSYAFLGGGNLRVQTTYYIAYQISRNILSVIRKELDRLCDSLTTGIQVYESVSTTSPVDSVVLRLCGSDLVAFTKTRRDLDLLTGGEVILMDGKPLWDDYFDLPSSTRIIEQLNSQGSFFIERDFRNRHILVFGQKARGEEMLLKLLNKVWEQVVTMAVSDACIANMIRAGYPDEVAAKNKVHFDYACRAITVRGTADDREKVWSAISEYEAYSEPVLSARERTCALCHSEPPEPISLPCRHTFCRGCLQLWFKSLIGPNFTSVECIAAVDSVPDASEKQEGEISRCCAQVPYAFIHEVLSDEEEDDLLEYSFLSHIWAHLLEFRLCPTRNCPMVYRVGSPGTVIQCPGCRKDICISCHGELHEGLTCTECKLL